MFRTFTTVSKAGSLVGTLRETFPIRVSNLHFLLIQKKYCHLSHQHSVVNNFVMGGTRLFKFAATRKGLACSHFNYLELCRHIYFALQPF